VEHIDGVARCQGSMIAPSITASAPDEITSKVLRPNHPTVRSYLWTDSHLSSGRDHRLHGKWQQKAAIDRAGKSLRDLRVAEVVQLDLQMNKGKIEAYRAKLRVSFKFED
jgi:hypothetical protein